MRRGDSFGLRKFPDSFKQAVSRAPSCIYSLGCPHPALSFHFLQRITASELAPGLQYFGCSIHGQLDLDEDGLVDLAVGALGNAVILWLVPPFFMILGLSWGSWWIQGLKDTLWILCLLSLITVGQIHPILTPLWLQISFLWNHYKLFWSPNPSSQWGSEILELFSD